QTKSAPAVALWRVVLTQVSCCHACSKKSSGSTLGTLRSSPLVEPQRGSSSTPPAPLADSGRSHPPALVRSSGGARVDRASGQFSSAAQRAMPVFQGLLAPQRLSRTRSGNGDAWSRFGACGLSPRRGDPRPTKARRPRCPMRVARRVERTDRDPQSLDNALRTRAPRLPDDG